MIGIRLRANAFLHHMVRNIVGSLVYVGTGRESLSWFKEVFEAKDRTLAAPTFAASGLYLVGVKYPDFPDLPTHSPTIFNFP
jgi:tRNA pseudouridine38-40 synthase